MHIALQRQNLHYNRIICSLCNMTHFPMHAYSWNHGIIQSEGHLGNLAFAWTVQVPPLHSMLFPFNYIELCFESDCQISFTTLLSSKFQIKTIKEMPFHINSHAHTPEKKKRKCQKTFIDPVIGIISNSPILLKTLTCWIIRMLLHWVAEGVGNQMEYSM